MDSPNKIQKYKSTHNLDIFWATDSMEIHMDCPTKWQSTKVQKSTKNDKNPKNVKSTKVQKTPAPAISSKKSKI